MADAHIGPTVFAALINDPQVAILFTSGMLAGSPMLGSAAISLVNAGLKGAGLDILLKDAGNRNTARSCVVSSLEHASEQYCTDTLFAVVLY